MKRSANRPRAALPALGLACLLALVQATCIGLTEERTELDRSVGAHRGEGLTLDVDEGLASIQGVEPGAVRLWAQSPVLEFGLATDDDAVESWRVTVDNCMPDAELVVIDGDAVEADPLDTDYPAQCRFELSIAPGSRATLRLAPPDWDLDEPWRFAILSDVQRAVDEVQEIFEGINDQPGLRFVVSTGDLTNDGTAEEILFFQRRMRSLKIPLYSTTGNHEVNRGDSWPWHELWGRYNFHFDFKGVGFSFTDSSNASLAPTTYEWLGGWLDDHLEGVHVFVTHIPPLDPFGTRNGAFRSRHEAGKLLNLLAEGEVDLNVHGHLHTLLVAENAGIPTYISGGGGAIPERMDGIARHFLTVDVDPAEGVRQVGVVRID